MVLCGPVIELCVACDFNMSSGRGAKVGDRLQHIQRPCPLSEKILSQICENKVLQRHHSADDFVNSSKQHVISTHLILSLKENKTLAL